jgi:pilus assembly protein CpaD
MTHHTLVKTVLRAGLLSAALVSLAACASAPSEDGPSKTAATETQQWTDKIKVTSAPDEIVLATHASGLSANQSSALEALVERWLQAEGRELVVTARTPPAAWRPRSATA